MNQPDADFMHIPVLFARQLADACNKDQVVILSYDNSCGMLTTTTWGRSAADKVVAAMAGDQLCAVACGGMTQRLVQQDFRLVENAELMIEIDRLQKRCDELEQQLTSELNAAHSSVG